MIPFIDHEPIIAQFGGRGQRAQDYMEATKRLSDYFRGSAQINDSGVFVEAKVAVRATVKNCQADITIAQTGTGVWLLGHRYSSPTSGSGSAPSVWNRKAYATESDAARAGIEEAARWFEAHSKTLNSCAGEAELKNAAELAAQLRRRIEEPDLLELAAQSAPALPAPKAAPKPEQPKPQQLSLF